MKIFRISQDKEVTSAVVVVRDKSVLILKRGASAPWMPNMWNLPGGGVEDGESIESAAKRECQEEAGISVNLIRKITTHYDEDFDLHIFEATTDSSEVSINFESSQYAWIDRDSVEKYSFVPYVKEAIVSVLRK